MRSKARALTLVMKILIIAPVLLVCTVGWFSVHSFSSTFFDQSYETLARAQIAEITDVAVGYSDFLADCAELAFIAETALENPEARVQANNFLTLYAENAKGVFDIIITNADGRIFYSFAGQYEPATAFRDDAAALQGITALPASVSGFYDGGRFYCAKAVRDLDGVLAGYIILESRTELIREMSESPPFEPGNPDKLTLTVTDNPASPLPNEIAGTNWTWDFSYSPSAAFSFAFGTWIVAFAVAAGISAGNFFIMRAVTKKRKS